MAKYRLLPKNRDREAGAAVAAVVGAHAHLTVVAVEAHEHDVLPRIVVILGEVELVASGEESGELVVVDGPDHVREHPRDDKQLVGKGLHATHRHDAVTLAVGVEVGHDPLDDRVVRVVAIQEPQALHGRALALDFARVEVLPAVEATLAEDVLDAGVMRL